MTAHLRDEQIQDALDGRLPEPTLASLRDHSLAPGQWRPLTQAEIRALYAAIQKEILDA